MTGRGQVVVDGVVAATTTIAASSPTGAALTAGAIYLFFRFRR